MTIKLTQSVRHGGSVLAADTIQTLETSIEADLVARNCATWLSNPADELSYKPVTAKTNPLTGGIELSAGAANVITLPTVLYDSAVPVSLTGTTTKTALASIVVPAGRMGENSTLRITPVWAYTNSANNKSFGVEIGTAMPGVSVYARTRTTSQSECPLIELQNRGIVSSQISKYSAVGSFSTNQISANETWTIDFAQQQTVFVYATLANASDTVTLAALRVEVIGAQ